MTTARQNPFAHDARRLGLVLLTLAGVAIAPLPAHAEMETEVRVDRARPQTAKHATLRFLNENRDFLRGELDRLREKRVQRDGDAVAIEPRFLAYREMVAQVIAGRDSVGLAAEAQARRELLTSVSQLGDLERQLDQLDRTLMAQCSRLGVLQEDFTGDQRTALAIVLSGYPQDVPVSDVAVTLEDGTNVAVTLTAEQRDALRLGGAIQVFHGYIEPRQQVVEVSLAGNSGFMTLEPARDRLTLLRLDLSLVHNGDGPAGLHATCWLNDARVP